VPSAFAVSVVTSLLAAFLMVIMAWPMGMPAVEVIVPTIVVSGDCPAQGRMASKQSTQSLGSARQSCHLSPVEERKNNLIGGARTAVFVGCKPAQLSLAA